MSPSPRRRRFTRPVRVSSPVALILGALFALLTPGISLAADTAAPAVTSSSASPSWVNVTTASKTVTVTFHVTDETGVKGTPVVTGYSDLSHQTTAAVPVTLASGTPLNGTYTAKLTIPKSAVGGGWTAKVDALVDHAGNTTKSQFVISHFTVFAIGFDTVAPKLVSSTITPNAVDVTAAPATITVTVRVTDDYSGTKAPVITVTAPGGTSPNAGGPTILTSGDKLDGVWTLTATIPKGTPSGAWLVQLAPLSDQSGNNGGQFTTLGTINVKSGGAAGPTPTPTPASSTTIVNNTTNTTNTSTAGTGGVLGTTARSKSFITLLSKSVKVTKSGTLSASLHCTGTVSCRGSVRFYRTVKGVKRKVVSRRLSIAVGKTVKVRFTLTKIGKKFVLRGKKYKTSVYVWTDGIAAPRTAKLTVKRAK